VTTVTTTPPSNGFALKFVSIVVSVLIMIWRAALQAKVDGLSGFLKDCHCHTALKPPSWIFISSVCCNI
jgi:hypothetical protein